MAFDRLRRDIKNPPVGTKIGTDVILPEIEVDRTGESLVPTHPGGGASTAIGANYRDLADTKLPDRPPPHPHGPPFTMKR